MRFFLTILFISIYSSHLAQVNHFPISKKGKWGVIDSSGNIILPPELDYLFPFKNNVSIFKKSNYYGLVNTNKAIIKKNIYDGITDLNKSHKGQFLYLLTKDSKQGIVNDAGIEIAPLIYNNIQVQDRFYFAKKDSNQIDVGDFDNGLIFSRKSDSISLTNFNFFKSQEQNQELLLDNKGKELAKDSLLNISYTSRGNIVYFGTNKLMFFDTNYQKIIDTNLVFIGSSKDFLNFKDSSNKNISYSYFFNKIFTNSTGLFVKKIGDYWIVKNNDLFGVIDKKLKQIIPCKFKSIKLFEGHFYAKNESNKTAIFTKEFKQIMPPVYEKIVKTNYGFEYQINNKVGALNKKGKKITEARFTFIDQNSIPIKCYLPKQGIVQLIFDEKWNYQSKKEFKQMLTLQSKKEIKEVTKFPPSDSTTKIVTKDFGWFLDTIAKEKDGKVFKITKWGLKNEIDSIVTPPIYREYEIINDSISFGYRGVKKLKKSDKRIKGIPVASSFNIVNHLSGAVLIKQPTYKCHWNDFNKNNLIRILTKKGISLYDKNLKVINDNIHYAFKPNEGMLLYSILNENKKEKTLHKGGIKKLTAWLTYGSGIFISETARKEYFDMKSNRGTKEVYFSNKIKYGFYNSLTGQNIFPAHYDFAQAFNRGISFVGIKQKKGDLKYGALNKNKVIIPIQYDNVDHFSPKNYDSLYIVQLNNGKKLILDSLLNVKELKLTNINRVKENVIIAREKNKYGVLDDNFNWAIKPTYKKINASRTEKLIFKDKKYGVLSPKGTEVSAPLIPKQYIIPLKNGALVYNNKTLKGKVYYYDYKYGELFKPISGVVYESDSLVLKVSNKIPDYYKDGTKLKTNHVFSSTTLFENNKYSITKKGKRTKIINKTTKKEVLRKSLIVQSLKDEGIYFIENNNKGLLSFNGDTLIKTDSSFSEITRINDNLLLTRSHINKQRYLYGLSTLKGKQILPSEFLKIEKVFDSIYFCFKKIGASVFLNTDGDTLKILNCRDYSAGEFFLYKSGENAYFLDKKLKKVFKYNFIDAEPFIKGLATVLTKEGWQILNNNGDIISMGCFNSLKPIAQNTLIAQEKSKYGLYNYKGEIIVPVEFEQINGISSTVVQVIKEGKVGYINTSGKWLYNPF